MPRMIVALVAMMWLFSNPMQVKAQGAAVSLSIDPSVRSTGMGHATSSIFWGDEPNYWVNPALLGSHSGLHYEWQQVQLVPELADEIYFKSNRFTLGAWGLGVAVSAKPYRLDYGLQEATDSMGNSLGTVHSYEDIRSYGFGINVVELAESVMRGIQLNQPEPGRYFDFSLGMMFKKVDLNFGPDPSARGSGESRDFGIQARLTPFNSIDHPIPDYVQDHVPSLAALLDQVGGLRLDFTMARSWLNYDDRQVSFGAGVQSDPILQDNRRGMGFRLVSGVPADKRSVLQGGSWLAALFTPVVSFGMAWDRSAIDWSPNGELLAHYSGWEATLLNVFTVRGGRTDFPRAGVNGTHSGWGLGFRLGEIVGVRWDEARRPQAVGLREVKHRGLSAFVDFVALGDWGLDR